MCGSMGMGSHLGLIFGRAGVKDCLFEGMVYRSGVAVLHQDKTCPGVFAPGRNVQQIS